MKTAATEIVLRENTIITMATRLISMKTEFAHMITMIEPDGALAQVLALSHPDIGILQVRPDLPLRFYPLPVLLQLRPFCRYRCLKRPKRPKPVRLNLELVF